ncbi:transport permease protein [Geotalea uraniireducens]|uniref:Transport permease protein n=1 Tax=Geotalea uraniireducens TaxID=351604 RepID=A0ABN6VV32_9BACT|nr:ABC transporter permease [Geotalea uraniireducens]BDV43040.1 transport permease protein [Geotalea uraniireducens]
MVGDKKTLFDYRDLFFMITWREIKIKYKQSIMGFLWALFMPILIITSGILVKMAFAKLAGTPFTFQEVAGVSVKAIPWAFFISSIRFSTNSLISNFNLVTKISFPKIIFPLSAICSQLVDFVVASLFLMVVLMANGYGLTVKALFAFVLILILIVLSAALGILFSAANLFFRDVKYIVEVIVTFAIFFTPVFYDVKMFDKWERVLLLNPVAPVLEGLNGCLVLGTIPYGGWIVYSAVFSVALLAIAVFLFQKIEPLFAENI